MLGVRIQPREAMVEETVVRIQGQAEPHLEGSLRDLLDGEPSLGLLYGVELGLDVCTGARTRKARHGSLRSHGFGSWTMETLGHQGSRVGTIVTLKHHQYELYYVSEREGGGEGI